MPFKHELGALATLKMSLEAGEVIGRAEYATGEPQYYLRYRCADGRQVECWWAESALAEPLPEVDFSDLHDPDYIPF